MSALDRPRERRRDRRDAGRACARRSPPARSACRPAPTTRPRTPPPPTRSAQVFEPLRGTDALIASHIRDEGERVLESMDEAMAIAGRARRAAGALAPQGARPRELRPLARDARAARRGAPHARRLPRLLSVHRVVDGAAQGRRRAGAARAGRVVEGAARGGRPLSRRARAPSGGSTVDAHDRRAAARRRDLLLDGRGRRRAHPRASRDDDRLRRPAARRVPAPAAVGRVPARARALRPRSATCSRSKRRCTG